MTISSQVQSYSKSQKESLQEDLNKLYDLNTKGLLKSQERSNNNNNNFSESPYFDFNHSGNVTAILFKTALLNCRVKNLGNKTVSWIRHDDTHLLTIGRYTYTSDLRFKAIHKIHSEDYLLQIKPTTRRDAGRYECQISSTPPMSHIVNLLIAEPKTSIIGGIGDIFFDQGSTINLTCLISDSPEAPSYIFWRHNQDIISYDSSRGGVSIITEKGLEHTYSSLIILFAIPSDTGEYTCSPSHGPSVTVNVHVLRGEKPHQLLYTNEGVKIKMNVINVAVLQLSLLLCSLLFKPKI